MKAALYVCVSPKQDDWKELLDHQKLRLREYACETGSEVVEVYYDLLGGKEGLEVLVEDAKMGKFAVVVAMSLEQLLRGTAFAQELRLELMLGDLHLVTLDGLVDTFKGAEYLIGMYDWIYAQNDWRNVFEGLY